MPLNEIQALVLQLNEGNLQVWLDLPASCITDINE